MIVNDSLEISNVVTDMRICQADDGEAFLRHTLTKTYSSEVVSVAKLAYDPACPFPYNNFLYDLTLKKIGSLRCPTDPCHLQTCSNIPGGISRAVARIPNAAAKVRQDNRIENEIAAMTLARQALQSCSMAHLVPDIYLWHTVAKGGQGWMLKEYKPSVQLAEIMPRLDGHQKAGIFAQLAIVFAALQAYELPPSVSRFGGLSYGLDGGVISGEMTTIPIEANRTYVEFLSARVDTHLHIAKRFGGDQGWVDDSIEFGIQSALDNTLPKIMATQGPHTVHTPVHGDFSASNILIDHETLALTALLDFDFAYVGSKLDDFLLSMRGIGSQLIGPIAAENVDNLKLTREAILTGDWEGGPASAITPNEDAALWYEALRQAGALTPDMMANSRGLSVIWELGDLHCPFLLCEEVVAARRTPEQRRRDVADSRHAIREALDRLAED